MNVRVNEGITERKQMENFVNDVLRRETCALEAVRAN